MVANPTAVPTCPIATLDIEGGSSGCPVTTVVGTATIEGGTPSHSPVYNLSHGPSSPGLFGFVSNGVPVFLEGIVRPGDYGVSALSPRTSQAIFITDARVELWGVRADPSHDSKRGQNEQPASRPLPPTPFITSPTSCPAQPQVFTASTTYWRPYPESRLSTGVDAAGTPFVFSGATDFRSRPR